MSEKYLMRPMFGLEFVSCRFLRPDMTEKLLTGTLSLNTTNHVGFYIYISFLRHFGVRNTYEIEFH